MNKIEKALLRDIIRAVAGHNKNAWWELKRQIFDGGYGSDYPAQGDFDFPAARAIERLSVETKAALIDVWRHAAPKRPDYENDEVLAAYARLIVEEVVERARIGAYRAVNW